MLSFFVRRLLQLVLALLGISTILFLLIRMSGDPAALLAGPNASADQVADVRRQLGLADPLPAQYVRFVGQLAQLDFGESFWYQDDALRIAISRIGPTAQLAAASMTLAVLVAFPVGIVAATRRGSALSHLLTIMALMGQTVPVFWLALVLILAFAVNLRWLPSFGYGEPQHFVLPVLALGALPLAKLMRLVRSGMLDVLGQDYMRTARAKGLVEHVILYRHGVRNMLIPVVTVIGLELGQLMGGAVITETVFTWPGIGRELIQAVSVRDYPLLQALVFVMGFVVVLINMAVDAIYRGLDPRVGVR